MLLLDVPAVIAHQQVNTVGDDGSTGPRSGDTVPAGVV